MKTLPLRTLLREPNKVKKMTRGGMVVRITDRGEPLWDLQPVASPSGGAERDRAIDKILDDALKEKPDKLSLAKIIIDSRDEHSIKG